MHEPGTACDWRVAPRFRYRPQTANDYPASAVYSGQSFREHILTRSLVSLAIALLYSVPAAAQTQVDVLGVDHFWAVADRLAADSEPSPEAWRRLLDAPAYRQLNRDARLQRMLRLAYQPSAQLTRDSILRTGSYDAHVLEHLRRVPTERARLQRFRDSLISVDLVSAAGHLAQAYLPPGQLDRRPPPVIAFGIYGPEAYGAELGITMDLLFALDRGPYLLPILAHEVHHVHVASLTTFRLPERSSPAFVLLQALRNLANEGTADRINLRFPVSPPAMTAAAAPAYNSAYNQAHSTLLGIDSLLTQIGQDTAMLRRAGAELSNRLVYAGHPVGAYMAERIEETLGRQALIEILGNPFAFLRTYNDAEGHRAGRKPFTAATLALVSSLESQFFRPPEH